MSFEKAELYTYEGKTMNFSQWAKALRISTQTMRAHVEYMGGYETIDKYLRNNQRLHDRIFGLPAQELIDWFIQKYRTEYVYISVLED